MMDDQIEYQNVMWAEMKPDVYAGENLDEHRPGWECYTDGDMGEETGLDTIELPAMRFPPGTKITVEVPCCPECGLSADYDREGDCCECGFDWKAWAEEQYS
ncbi:hypothetical protein [Halomonas elongata]|uniref:hypothetical protein n=1 Tax=Halomonas elongata TaxID=2746 RepID=UPI00186B6E1C|nr:hypothetical protein [Halomonas elongata]MBW5800081.1 hypothetical protein [Halomonas elongata]